LRRVCYYHSLVPPFFPYSIPSIWTLTLTPPALSARVCGRSGRSSLGLMDPFLANTLFSTLRFPTPWSTLTGASALAFVLFFILLNPSALLPLFQFPFPLILTGFRILFTYDFFCSCLSFINLIRFFFLPRRPDQTRRALPNTFFTGSSFARVPPSPLAAEFRFLTRYSNLSFAFCSFTPPDIFGSADPDPLAPRTRPFPVSLAFPSSSWATFSISSRIFLGVFFFPPPFVCFLRIAPPPPAALFSFLTFFGSGSPSMTELSD